MSHQPKRDDDVITWLLKWRDEYSASDIRYHVIDDMVDDYRLHADTGTSLLEPVNER